MAPVQIVHLYLRKVPVVFILTVEQPVEGTHIAMIREAQMPDAAGLAFLEQEVEKAVVQEPAFQTIDTATTNTMQQIIVNIVDTQTFEGSFIHFLSSVEIPQSLILVRHLCGYVVLLPWVTTQRTARLVFVPTALIHGSSIKIVHPMSNGIVHQTVHILLVVRKTHHTKAQQGNLLARAVLHTIGHPHLIVTAHHIIGLPVACQHAQRLHSHHSQGRANPRAKPLKKLASVHVCLLFFHKVFVLGYFCVVEICQLLRFFK